MVVDIEDVFDEFGFGAHDPQAITEFFRYALSNWQTRPRYALFVGHSTFDPRDYFGNGAKLGFAGLDLVPTKQIVTVYSKTHSDDALADFTNDGLSALAIGRLPARTPDEAQRMIARIINYTPSANGQRILFIADQTQSDYSFIEENNSLRPYLPSGTTVQTVNRDDANDTVIHSRIVDGINSGPFVVNYAGHGASDFWTKGNVFSVSDARALTNGSQLPFFSLMTCYNGYSQYPSLTDSLAEALMKAPNGGAVAVWASSGATVPTGQTIMNNGLFRRVFGDNPSTLGEMIRQSKPATDDIDVRRTWILFGDPTLRIR